MSFRDFTIEAIHVNLKFRTREVRLFAELPPMVV
jgi:hypothetical protein